MGPACSGQTDQGVSSGLSDLLFASVVTSASLLEFSNPWFPHKYNGDINIHITGLLLGGCEKRRKKYMYSTY